MEAEPTFELWYFKKSKDGQSPKKEIVSVNSTHALFSLLFALDNLVMRALICL
jgi:hypothetical protein